MLAARVYLGRFEQLFEDHTIFAGVTYTEAHVTLTGMLVVSIALGVGALLALVNAVSAPRVRWLVLAVAPAAVCYILTGIASWYVTSFIVKPNELVREAPFITHNIEMTRKAFALDRIEQHPFPADSGVEAVDAAHNQDTLQNIRLWDWRALQDTLRQIQEIRTYYDFPDIDIDRYTVNGSVRQMMLAARELNVEKLPESSRNWINEKLIYTHGYGVTMNPVNGFTPEGLPTLILSNMPVQSTIPSLKVTRPEIYFGELTNTDVYVKTRQKEFNYPQGETNSLTSYEGNGGIQLGGFFRRLIIALDRGDLAKLPFSDDVTPESRLLMRRNIRDRVAALAPFLTFDEDPYIIVGDDGRLAWMMDGYTTSESYPYARHFRMGRDRVNYMRNSVKAIVDAYDGTTTFYVFDAEDPIIAAYRGVFPSLFKDGSAMPAGMRKHVRYPELLLQMQAAVYGLYHMTDPGVFYNREDLWSVATEGGSTSERGQAAQTMEPNFVLMTLPGEKTAGVRRDPAVHAGEPQQPDRLDRRTQRRAELRQGGRLRLPEDEAGRRSAAGRSAHRSERAAVGPAVVVEPAGIARPPRRAARDPGRTRAALRRADLSAGGAEPDAGAAARGAGAAGSARLRTDVRGGDGRAVRQRPVDAGDRAECAAAIHVERLRRARLRRPSAATAAGAGSRPT